MTQQQQLAQLDAAISNEYQALLAEAERIDKEVSKAVRKRALLEIGAPIAMIVLGLISIAASGLLATVLIIGGLVLLVRMRTSSRGKRMQIKELQQVLGRYMEYYRTALQHPQSSDTPSQQ